MSDLTDRQLAIILGALRMAQEELPTLNHMPYTDEFEQPVNAEEIDQLCESLCLA